MNKKILGLLMVAAFVVVGVTTANTTSAQNVTCAELRAAGLDEAEIALWASLAGMDCSNNSGGDVQQDVDELLIEIISAQVLLGSDNLRDYLATMSAIDGLVNDIEPYSNVSGIGNVLFNQGVGNLSTAKTWYQFLLRFSDNPPLYSYIKGIIDTQLRGAHSAFTSFRNVISDEPEPPTPPVDRDRGDFKFKCDLSNTSHQDAAYNQYDKNLYIVRKNNNGTTEVVSINPETCLETGVYQLALNGSGYIDQVSGIAFGRYSTDNQRRATDNYLFADSSSVYLGTKSGNTFRLDRVANHNVGTAQGASFAGKGGPVMHVVHNTASDELGGVDLDSQNGYRYIVNDINVPTNAPYGLTIASTHHLLAGPGVVYGMEYNTGQIYETYRFSGSDNYLSGLAYNPSKEIAYVINNDNDTLYTLDVSDLNDMPIITRGQGGMEISESSNNPDSSTILVDYDDESDDYTIFVFDVSNESYNDVELGTVYLTVNTDESDPRDVIADIDLFVDGRSYPGTFNRLVNSEEAVYRFNVPKAINAQDEIELEVIASFNSFDGAYESDQEIAVFANYEDEFSSSYDVDGRAASDEHRLSVGGLMLDDYDYEIYAGDGRVDAELVVELYAIEQDVYLETGIEAFDVKFENTSGSSVSGTDSYFVTSTAPIRNGKYVIEENESETFYVVGSLVPNQSGYVRMAIDDIGFKTSPSQNSRSYLITPNLVTEFVSVQPREVTVSPTIKNLEFGDDQPYSGERLTLNIDIDNNSANTNAVLSATCDPGVSWSLKVYGELCGSGNSFTLSTQGMDRSGFSGPVYASTGKEGGVEVTLKVYDANQRLTDSRTVKAEVQSESEPEVEAINDRHRVNGTQSVTFNPTLNDVGSNLVVYGFSTPRYGSIRLNGNQITYSPRDMGDALQYEDSFTYSISDGQTSDTATVNIDYDWSNVASTKPTIKNLEFGDDQPYSGERLTLNIDIDNNSANTNAVLSATCDPGVSWSLKVYGELCGSGNSFTLSTRDMDSTTLSGTVSDRNNSGGFVNATLKVYDANQRLTDSRTVKAEVQSEDVPDSSLKAVDDRVTLPSSKDSVSFEPLSNDVNPYGANLTITSISNPANASIQLIGGNLIVYILRSETGYTSDSFTYTISDGQESSTARVHVTYEPRTQTSDGRSRTAGNESRSEILQRLVELLQR